MKLFSLRKIIQTFAIATAVMGISTFAYAKGGDDKRHEKRDPCERLKCTAQQKTQVRSVFKEIHTDVRVEFEAIRKLHKQLSTEYVKDSLNESTIADLRKELAVHHENVANRFHDGLMELHPMLTQEQRKKLVRMLAKRHRMRHKGKGKGNKKGKKHRD